MLFRVYKYWDALRSTSVDIIPNTAATAAAAKSTLALKKYVTFGQRCLFIFCETIYTFSYGLPMVSSSSLYISSAYYSDAECSVAFFARGKQLNDNLN